MIRLGGVLAALALAGCAGPASTLRQGSPVQIVTPQAADQCAAQPELDWCKARARR